MNTINDFGLFDINRHERNKLSKWSKWIQYKKKNAMDKRNH